MVLIALLLFIVGGCSTIHNSEVKQQVEDHNQSITLSAERIDTIVADSPFAKPVKVETDRIRDQASKLQFEEIDGYYKSQFDAAKTEYNASLTDGAKKLKQSLIIADRLKAENDQLRNKAREEQTTWLNGLGVGLLLLSGVLLYLRQPEFAGISLFSSLSFFGVAQLLDQWWFVYLCGGLLTVVVLAVLFIVYRKRVGEETATVVFSELEKAYNEGTPEDKAWMDTKVFSRLSSKMDAKHKRFIESVRL